MIIYSILSGTAGIFTEYLMKSRPSDSFYLQNVKMYSWGVIINMSMLVFFHKGPLEDGIHNLNKWLTGLVVVNHALAGLFIAAVIKYGDNIARVYAHSMGMLLTMVVSSFMFWQIPSIQLLFGMSVVIISLYLFYTVGAESRRNILTLSPEQRRVN